MNELNVRINETATYAHTIKNPGKVMLAGRGDKETYSSLRADGFTPAEIASYKAACGAAWTENNRSE